VLNNPLSLTDPTGYFFSGLFKAIGNAFRSAFRAIGSKAVLKSTIGRAVIQIAVCALDPIAACAAVAAGLTAAAGGSVVNAIKAAAFSLVQFGVWDQVGYALVNAAITTKTLVHGVVGGALSVAQGGSFLQGFASAAIGQVTGTASELAFGPAGTGGELGFAGRTAAAALGGGLAAEITGGKFANGAVTAAFARMFNDEGLHEEVAAELVEFGSDLANAAEEFQIAMAQCRPGGPDFMCHFGPEMGGGGRGGASGGPTKSGGPPKPSPNFVTPTNPPQLPPNPSNLPPGHTVRVGPPTEQYPSGYWRQYNQQGQAVDPSNGRPPSNVTSSEFRARTHVPLPPGR
jgi:hypothetical protein